MALQWIGLRARAAIRGLVITLVLAVALAVAWQLAVRPAFAQGLGEPVIVGGREAEVLALIRPLALGAEIAPGFRLMDVKIEPTRVLFIARGPANEEATLTLEHPTRAAQGAIQSKSFALVRDERAARAPPGSPAVRALDALAAAVIANDTGGFWRDTAVIFPGDKGQSDRSLALRLWDAIVAIATDGIILAALSVGLLIALAAHRLRSAPRWVIVALIGVVALGAFARVSVAPRAALGVWPYSRLYDVARLIYSGPVLGSITQRFGLSIALTDVLFATTLALAVLTPLAMFTHASYVLRDSREALAAAALIAILPSHVRFSHSDSEFIPSIALGAVSFTLLHALFLERRAGVRRLAGALLGPALYAAVCARELNILLVPLLLAALYAFHYRRGSRGKLALTAALLIGVGSFAFVRVHLARYDHQIREGLSLDTLTNAGRVLVDPTLNTLLNSSITPIIFLALVALGAMQLVRREARHAAFLLGWFGLYFVAHAYVVSDVPAMQARYHLHLAPPLVLLAAPALVRLWIAAKPIGAIASLSLALAPWTHRAFVRDTGFNDMREYAFLEAVRHKVPDGCTVLEYLGPGEPSREARFSRMGAALDKGRRASRFRAIGVGGATEPLSAEARALIAAPPACLFVYKGLLCQGQKALDEPIAPACAALSDALALEPVATTSFPSRPYDPNLAVGLPQGEDAKTQITIGLYRVVGTKVRGRVDD